MKRAVDERPRVIQAFRGEKALEMAQLVLETPAKQQLRVLLVKLLKLIQRRRVLAHFAEKKSSARGGSPDQAAEKLFAVLTELLARLFPAFG
ncbi:unnamed protein product [Tilletia controversa]|uniref:Uncharacterized protein n=2 Tax=Tilletia TaxID=13289 RepID=A0A177VAS2_9BASI|nr:hypothetical protein CF335_g8762 [Tilletia laevis]KAE8185294.1 hypothetical protein CF328_g7591 [Tilletia controversa]KAE8261688.1 hypothetical protein A4X03_0g3041 [Tilletia caries]CAD6916502.1 unnamed protein product [Tilletia laevis]CAD6916503.1 unnamed protein product [Tilletia caries]